jgi:L-2,4-diaminobutyrate decarboxylase
LDSEFLDEPGGLRHALDLLRYDYPCVGPLDLPSKLPETGLGSRAMLDRLAPNILGGAARLGAATSFAHMDPPTPWITWATTLWNASLNQNLLHPETAPVARDVEKRVVEWLAPFFGMMGGHMTSGSTLANLTALWAARECTGIETVIASDGAHLSIEKAAHLLGLRYRALRTDPGGALVAESLPDNLARAALVLTAGTTSTGAIDPLDLAGRAAWTHVDAAWAGPLRLSAYADRLGGIERADSVAMSAHKWLFQPKESALVLFRDVTTAHAAISFGGAYLAVPNVGVLGSHGATAVPLLATLLAWGRGGLAARIEHCMRLAQQLAEFVLGDSRLVLLAEPQTGIVAWRPHDIATFESVSQHLPAGAASMTKIAGERWFRSVAANPNADIKLLISGLRKALYEVRLA